jgi:hypothetical protein
VYVFSGFSNVVKEFRVHGKRVLCHGMGAAMSRSVAVACAALRHDWFYHTSTKCAIPDDMAALT